MRDVYDLGEALLLVATDRASAFDVVLPQAVPGKGRVLTLLSAWWFARTRDLVPNHFLTVDPERILQLYPALAASRAAWERRGMLVRKVHPLPVECVVRGYLSGSAWKEYRATGTLAGEPLPAGLAESDPLPRPVFSPATKAETGHDENIPFARVEAELGTPIAARLRDASLALFQYGSETAARVRLLLADTKFEFAVEGDRVVLIDELLTPDSSRFWPEEHYQPGRAQPSLDKQPLRDHLERLTAAGKWNKQPPGPELPEAVIRDTLRRYEEVMQRLTGYGPEDFPLRELEAP